MPTANVHQERSAFFDVTGTYAQRSWNVFRRTTTFYDVPFFFPKLNRLANTLYSDSVTAPLCYEVKILCKIGVYYIHYYVYLCLPYNYRVRINYHVFLPKNVQ